MKKLFFIISLLFCFSGFAQTFPLTQSIGGAPTSVQTAGTFKSLTGFTYLSFADTTAANVPLYISSTPGITILVAYSQLYVRNSTHNRWIAISGSSGGLTLADNGLTVVGGNTVELGGTLIQNTSIEANGNSLFIQDGFTNILSYTPGVTQLGGNNGFILTDNVSQEVIIGGNQTVKIQDASLGAASVGYVWTLVNGSGKGQWAAAATSSQNWQQTLDVGSTLNKDNTIDGGGFNLYFTNNTEVGMSSSTLSTLQAISNGGGLNGSFFNANVTGGAVIDAFRSGATSLLNVSPDSIMMFPFHGALNIDTLRAATTQTKLMGWGDAGNGMVGYVTLGGGLSLVAGVLSATAGNTIYTGDGTILSNRTAELNGKTLNFTQGGNTILFIDPTAGAEETDLMALNLTGGQNQASANFTTTNTNATSLFSATFNGGIKTATITASADASFGQIIQTSDYNEINGTLVSSEVGVGGTAYMTVVSSGSSPIVDFETLGTSKNSRLYISPDSMFFSQPDGYYRFATLATTTDTTTYKPVVADINGKIRRAGYWAGSGGSTPNLLQVTTVGDFADSILYRLITSFTVPNAIYKFGNSITANLENGGSMTTSVIYVNQYAASIGLQPPADYAHPGHGISLAIQSHNAAIQPGSRAMSTWMGVNDPQNGSATTLRRKMYNKIIGGLKAMFLNQNLASYVASGTSVNITRSAGWVTNIDETLTYGKTTNGIKTTTLNDSVVYTFIDKPNVGVGLMGRDSTTVSGALFEVVLRDITAGTNVVDEFITENSKTDGQDGGTVSPMAIIYAGLNRTHTYSLKLISKQATNILEVDYFGHMVAPAQGVPMVWLHPSYRTAVGYATSPAVIGGSAVGNQIIDSVKTEMDSLRTALLTLGAYPLYRVTNCVDTATGLESDGVHWNNTGHNQQFACMTAQLPQFIYRFQNYTVGNIGQSLYFERGDTLAKILMQGDIISPIASTGLTDNGGTWTNNLSTGVAGGQNLIGSTGTTSGLNIIATTAAGTTGANINFKTGTNGSINAMTIEPTAGYVGINNPNPGSTMLDIITSGQFIGGIRVKPTGTYSAFPISFYNSSNTLLMNISATGGGSFGGAPSFNMAGIHLGWDGANAQIYGYDGSNFKNVVVTALTLQASPSNGGVKFEVNGTETVVNDNSVAYNFRVESDGNANMLFVNGTNDRIGIATATPTVGLSVNAQIRVHAMATGTAGTDSVVTISGGVLKMISPTYYGTGGGSVTWNAITNPTGTQALSFDDAELTTWANGSNTETFLAITSNSLTSGIVESSTTSSITSGTLMNLVSTSTALAAGNELLNIAMSGVNGTNAITATGGRISVTNTNATSGTNVGLEITASGATTGNYAIVVPSGNVGIGTSTPATLLTVTLQSTIQAPVSGSISQFVGLDANPLRITFDTHNNSSASGTAMMGRRSRGTAAAPLALAANDVIFSINGRGYGTTQYAAASTGLLTINANQTFTDANNGTYVSISTTPDNSVTAAEALRITGAGAVNAIQAAGVYQINSVTVLSSTTLGSGVTVSSLNSFGTAPTFTAATTTFTLPTTTATTTSSGIVITANSLTSGTGFYMSGGARTSGTFMQMVGTSTTLAAGNELLDIALSGANGTNAITATGARISVTNTNATSGTNVALDLVASGATTNNFAITAAGSIQVTSANTSQATTASAISVAANSLTSGTAIYAASSTLSSGTIAQFVTTGTAKAANNEVLDIASSGANGTNAITVTGARISVTNTNATSGTNVGLEVTATGATTGNYAALFTGNVGINVSTPTADFHIGSAGISSRMKLTNNTSGTALADGADFQLNVNDVYLTNRESGFFQFEVAAGSVLVMSSTRLVGLGTVTSPTARLEIQAGTSSANTAPLKFNSGAVETTIRAGLVEFNDAYYVSTTALNRVALSGAIADFTTDGSNTGTGETDLYTYTTKASTLSATGQKLLAQFSGVFTDITATNQLQVYFAGTVIGNTGALTISAAGSWDVKVTIIRTGSTTARSIVAISTTGASTASYTSETDLTGITFTNTNIIKITGTAGGAGGGSGDIVSKLGTITWAGAANN